MWTSYIAIFRVENTGIFFGNISAINLNQIIVKFTQPVDETSAETASNYSLGGVNLTGSDKFELQSDKTTLVINLDTAKSQYSKAILKVKGSVISGDNASIVTVPEFTQELSFSDVTVPTVKSVKVTGNKKLTVEFSETVKMPAGFVTAAGTKFKIDGQYLTNYGFSSATAVNVTASLPVYANKIELNFATAIPAGTHNLTVLEGNSTDLVDAAGFKLAEQSSTFGIDAVTNAPQVVSVEGENNGTIYVTYDRSMDTTALTAANYKMNGTALGTAGTFKSGTNDTIVKFTGVPSIAKGANVLTIVKDTVKDSYGNKLDVNNDTRISFTATEDTVKPSVVSVTAITNTKVRVKFSEAVADTYATNLANYKLKDSSGTTITLNSTPVAVGSTPTDTYDITTPALTGSNYTLEIKNIVDTAATPNKIDTYTATFNGKDDVAPTVTEAVQVGTSPSQKVAVMFSEAMDASTITNLANYYYVDSASQVRTLPSGTTVVAGADNKSVEITFPSSYLVNGAGATAEYNVSNLVIGNIKDVAGNILSNISYTTSSIVAANSGTVKPTYVSDSLNVTASSDKVTVEFELNQNITSLVKADFLVGDGTAIVADANNLVADSAYVSGKKVVLEYTTASSITKLKGFGTGLKLTTVAAPSSTNIYGTKVAAISVASAKSVYDDMIAPKLLTVTAGATNTQVKLKFSEAIDATILGLYTDDFIVESNGQAISVSSVSIATTTFTNDTLVLNLASATSGTVTVKADPSKISIKSLNNDIAETADLYVPETADKDGSKTFVDITGPVLTSVVFADNTTVSANTFDADDTITFTFNEAVSATSIDAGLTAGGSITDTGVNLIAKMGAFATPMVLVPATDAATSTLSLSADGKTVTITTVGMAGAPGTAPSGVFTPVGTITDAASNAVTGTPAATGTF